jgi:DNA-binding HxlR family transcriptional regulator
MGRDATYLDQQRKLTQHIQASIRSLHNDYLEQIRLFTQWLMDQKLEEIRGSPTPLCSDLDTRLLSRFEEIFSKKSLVEVMKDLQSIQLEIVPENHEANCAEFWHSFIGFMGDQNEFLDELLQSSDPLLTHPGKSMQLSDLDSDRVYRTIIDPLSNSRRLDILQAIQDGNVRFKDLEETLALRAGHLLYHLNPLKEADYVVQDEHKNYDLSPKGRQMLNYLLGLYHKFEK